MDPVAQPRDHSGPERHPVPILRSRAMEHPALGQPGQTDRALCQVPAAAARSSISGAAQAGAAVWLRVPASAEQRSNDCRRTRAECSSSRGSARRLAPLTLRHAILMSTNMRILFAFICSALATPALVGQAKVAKEPGVAVTFSAVGTTDTRSQRIAAFYVPKGSSATPFIPA